MFSAFTILPEPTLSLEPFPVPISVPLTPDLVPEPLILPSFQHIPPSSIRGRSRWPYSLDQQTIPTDTIPCLMDILIHLRSYLTPDDKARTACISKLYSLGPEYGPLWFTRPWSLIDGAVGALERPIKTVLWWLTRLFRMVSSILCGHGGLLRNDMQQLLPARSGFSTTNYAATVCQHPLQS
jgi:hypothetical protein